MYSKEIVIFEITRFKFVYCCYYSEELGLDS
jgi:hypothetical protein